MSEDPAVLDELETLALHMAGYLSRADQVDRLISLFADDRWLSRRFDRQSGGWDDYQADLDEAWDALDRTLRDLSDDTAALVPQIVRLALVRATLSTVDNMPTPLVIAALSTGLWTIERTISVVSRNPSPEERAEMFFRLLEVPSLNEQTRRAICAQLLEIAQLPARDLPADVLISGLALLSPAERITVVDRVAATATVTWYSGGGRPTGPTLLQNTAVAAIESIPEARRPVLVRKVADSLLDSLAASKGTRSRDSDSSPERPPGQLPPLMDLQHRDMVSAMFASDASLDEAAVLLSRLAAFASAHPEPQRLRDQVAAAVSGVPTASVRDALIEAYRDTASAMHVRWTIPSTTHKRGEAPEQEDSQRGYRTELMAEVLRLHRGSPSVGKDPDDDYFSNPSLDELHRRWMAAVMPGLGPSETAVDADTHEAARGVDEADDSGSLVATEIQRIGGPVFAGVYAVVHQLPDEMLYKLVRSVADPGDIAGQFLMVTVLAEDKDEATRAALRKVKGGLVIAAIDHHFRSGGMAAAFRGIDRTEFADIDWDPVLAFVLSLPIEEQRDSLGQLYGFRGTANVDSVPRLAALRQILNHLSDRHVDVVLDNFRHIRDPAAQRSALGLLAPRLNATQVSEALRMIDGRSDVLEQLWFFNEVAAELGPSNSYAAQLTRWRLDLVDALRSGPDFGVVAFLAPERPGEGAMEERKPPDVTELPLDRILTALRSLDYNNRADAVLALARATTGELPDPLVDEILALPVANPIAKFSPRGWAIAVLADRVPEHAVERVFRAAMELPHRLHVGDSQAWGWNWSHEYPRGAAVYALARRLRGTVAQAAFEASQALPWVAREEVLQRLAENADEDLARALFDYSFAIHPKYAELPDSAPAPVPFEETVITQPVPTFRIHREVHFAEMIAATARHLDPDRLRRAVAQAQAFDNQGPRAWLPARLLPLLDEDEREPLLSSGVVAATEFMMYDPSRLDVMTDLLPFMQVEIERRAAVMAAFVEDRFPQWRGPLTSDQLNELAPTDRAEYRTLYSGIRPEDEGSFLNEEAGEDIKRQHLIRIILSPLFAERRQELLVALLGETPLVPRIEAMDAMQQILDPTSHAAVVAEALRQVQEAELDPLTRVRGVAGLLSRIPEGAHDTLIDLVWRLPGPPPGEDASLGSEMADLLLHDFSRPLRDDPRFDEFRHSLAAHAVTRTMSDDDAAVLRRLRGPRAMLIDSLGPTLSKIGLDNMIHFVLELPPIEQGDAIVALLPATDGDQRSRLRAALFSLPSAFGRFWALFNLQGELDDGEPDPSLRHLARTTAEGFSNPRTAAAILLLLISYADEDRQEWMRRVVDLSTGLEADERLSILSVITRLAGDSPGLRWLITDQICELPTLDSTYAALLMICRARLDLTHLPVDQRSVFNVAVSQRLRFAAQRGRAELLRILASEFNMLTALSTPDGAYQAASVVHDVCTEWRWPLAA